MGPSNIVVILECSSAFVPREPTFAERSCECPEEAARAVHMSRSVDTHRRRSQGCHEVPVARSPEPPFERPFHSGTGRMTSGSASAEAVIYHSREVGLIYGQLQL